jgi:ApaG protein
MSEAVTRGVRVVVEPEFVAERSNPSQGLFFFAYHVTVLNEGEEPVQLVSRHWIITDGLGKEQEVKGAGVVGEQPRIEPGEGFRYTSGCPLPTQIGCMRGTYRMVTDDGESFDAEIAPFTLAFPGALN